MLRFLRFKSQSSQSDEALLAAYQSDGDVAVLGQLYERYVELVYGVCLKYFKNEADAEDAVMAIFEQLVAKARAHEVENFRSWLYVLAKNHCLMQLRKPQREFSQDDFMHLDGVVHPEEGNAEDAEAQLRDCIEELNSEQRQAIELFYFENQSYQEIAEVKNEDLGRIRSYIQNGRRNLRICMEKKKEITR
jgi:RNA polymerase sigma-70 factor (ECF subfamily)